jgi:hypothetical protein
MTMRMLGVGASLVCILGSAVVSAEPAPLTSEQLSTLNYETTLWWDYMMQRDVGGALKLKDQFQRDWERSGRKDNGVSEQLARTLYFCSWKQKHAADNPTAISLCTESPALVQQAATKQGPQRAAKVAAKSVTTAPSQAAVPPATSIPASAEPSNGNAVGLGIVIALLSGIGLLVVQDRKQKADRHAAVERLTSEAQLWLKTAKASGKVSAPDVGPLMIPKGEHALLAEPSTLFELHADSTRRYLGTRVKVGSMPIYIGQSQGTSRKVLSKSSSGHVALTDKGLLFVGSSRTARIKAKDIVGVEPTLTTIVVNSATLKSPLVFQVGNPFTWFLAIKLVAAGEVTVNG